jgi:hypothetical protein
MFKQNRLERQAELSFLRYLSHMEAIGRSDALRVFNTSNQRKLERQVEQRLATYMNYIDTYMNHKHELARDNIRRRVITINTTLDLEERKQSQAARSNDLSR